MAQRNLLSEEAQNNLNTMCEKVNGTFSQRATDEAIKLVDAEHPLTSPQKLPGTLIYVGYNLAPVNGTDTVVGEVGEIQPQANSQAKNGPIPREQSPGGADRSKSRPWDRPSPNYASQGGNFINRKPSRDRDPTYRNQSRDRSPTYRIEVGRSKIFEELLYQSVPQDLNSKVPTTDLVPKGKM